MKLIVKVVIFLILNTFYLKVSSQELTNITNEYKKGRGLVVKGFIGYTFTSSGELRDSRNGYYRFYPKDDNSGRFCIDLYVIASYFIIPRVMSIGIGTGYSRSFKPDFNQLPVIFDLRGFIFQQKDALYLYLQYAPTLQVGDEFHKGGFMSIGVGYQFHVFGQHMNAEVGLRGRGANLERSSNNETTVRGLNINIGYVF